MIFIGSPMEIALYSTSCRTIFFTKLEEFYAKHV